MASKMDKRIPVTDQTHKRVTQFRDGAGLTYDEAINLLLDAVTSEEGVRAAGARLRYEVETGQRKHPTGSDDTSEGDRRRQQIA